MEHVKTASSSIFVVSHLPCSLSKLHLAQGSVQVNAGQGSRSLILVLVPSSSQHQRMLLVLHMHFRGFATICFHPLPYRTPEFRRTSVANVQLGRTERKKGAVRKKSVRALR